MALKKKTAGSGYQQLLYQANLILFSFSKFVIELH